MQHKGTAAWATLLIQLKHNKFISVGACSHADWRKASNVDESRNRLHNVASSSVLIYNHDLNRTAAAYNPEVVVLMWHKLIIKLQLGCPTFWAL